MPILRIVLRGIFILSIFGVAFLIGLILMDRMVMPMVVGYGQEIIVPDVTERPMDEAKGVLNGVGLGMILESELYDPVVPEEYIISQTPRAFSKVKKGRRIRVVVSRGSEQLTVPDLTRGISLRTAEIELKSAGFDLGSVLYQASAEIPKGVVISQSPLPNAIVSRGALVSVTVSSGPLTGYTLVPELLGLSTDNAISELQEAGLEVGEIFRVKREDLLPETVVEQSLEFGTEVERGTSIDITVTE